MNWFTLISVLIKVGSTVADNFIHNEQSKSTKTTVVSFLTAAVEGLANQNPDGTPASQPYTGPTAVVTPK